MVCVVEKQLERPIEVWFYDRGIGCGFIRLLQADGLKEGNRFALTAEGRALKKRHVFDDKGCFKPDLLIWSMQTLVSI